MFEKSLKLWWLQDRKYKRPVAELRMKIISSHANKNSLYRACSDLLVLLWKDAVTEFSYQASIAELESSIYFADGSFYLRVYGFDHKLQNLSNSLLKVLLSFAGRKSEDGLPSTIKEGRFDACLEILRRRYTNSGMKASAMSTDVRLRCLRSDNRSAHSKVRI